MEVLSKAGLITLILLFSTWMISVEGRFSIFTFFVNLYETAHEYLGILYDFAILQRVEVPILLTTNFFVNASAPNSRMSHIFSACSATRSGIITTGIFAFAKSLAVM